MRSRFFAVTLFFLFFLPAKLPLSAQPVEYRVGLGLKLGSPAAVSVKYMAEENHALELLAGGWLRAAGATLLYEYHIYVPNAPSLRWYLGAGAHCAYAAKHGYNPYSDSFVNNNVYAGFDAVFGLEYVFSNAPFSIAIDAIPVVNITGGVSLWWNAGVAFRYTFR